MQRSWSALVAAFCPFADPVLTDVQESLKV